jgi:hypothetical protein
VHCGHPITGPRSASSRPPCPRRIRCNHAQAVRSAGSGNTRGSRSAGHSRRVSPRAAQQAIQPDQQRPGLGWGQCSSVAVRLIAKLGVKASAASCWHAARSRFHVPSGRIGDAINSRALRNRSASSRSAATSARRAVSSSRCSLTHSGHPQALGLSGPCVGHVFQFMLVPQ